ncbi:MAG: amino acid kinase family protein [Bacteroidia bacterium]
MWVMKFGGGCLQNASAFPQVREILRHVHPHSPRLIVVSALHKTTNALHKLAALIEKKLVFEAQEQLQKIELFHQEIVETLLGSSAAPLIRRLQESYFTFLHQCIAQPARLHAWDPILSVGELVSSEILHAYLHKEGISCAWIDARQLIVTDGTPQRNILEAPTRANIEALLLPLFRRENLVITQGYIASDPRGRATTLGREGSDFSAALFAYYLKADGVIAWKDVGAILTADPTRHLQATPLPYLSYAQAAEMTFFGAKVLHPRTLRPLSRTGTPLYVRNFWQWEAEGTCIHTTPYPSLPPIYTEKPNALYLKVQNKEMAFLEGELLGRFFDILTRSGFVPYAIQAGAQAYHIVLADVQDIEPLRRNLPPSLTLEVLGKGTLHTVLYPPVDFSPPIEEAVFFQRNHTTIHWLICDSSS